MLLIAFVAFLLLLLAWLAAPNGVVREVAPVPVASPKIGDPATA